MTSPAAMTLLPPLLVCFLAACEGLSLPLQPRQRREVGELRYGVLLDGGSSSTKVKVYSYTRGQPPTYVPQVKLEVSKKVSPGLSDFASPTSRPELSVYLQGALKHARVAVPDHLHASTPVYVWSTAGVRSLPVDQAKELLEDIGRLLKQSSLNPFLFRDDYVSILSGEEEAVYAWVAANYLHGFFNSPMRREDSVGILEMGGGSMQVAFLPDGPLLQEEFQVYVGRRRFDLYAQSYLNYGSSYLRGQVFWRLWKDIVDNNKDRSLILSPCMLSGDTYNYTNKALGVTAPARGTGNASQCEQVLRKILLADPSDPPCSPTPCAIGDTYQPSVAGLKFYAFSAFLYAPKSLGALGPDGALRLEALRKNAEGYCKQTVEEAVRQFKVKAAFASDDCLQGLYISLLMTHALGFPENTSDITVSNTINASSIDWALGAMVQELSMSFLEEDPSATAIDCRRNVTRLPTQAPPSFNLTAGAATGSATTAVSSSLP